MKLNLLPSHVAKSQGSKAMIFVMVLIIAIAGAATWALITTGRGKLEAARDRADELRPKVATAMGNSQMADQVIQRVTGIDRNLKLTTAMTEHNVKYVGLYREVMGYIPSFYRINSMSAAPSGPDSCTVQMTGVLQTHKQYADLVVALYRMPGVVSVARNGYSDNSPYVPNLNTDDQFGTTIRPGEPNLPSDPDLRMQEMIRRANSGPTGFQGVGGFGQDVFPKGAMPDWSTVSVTMQIAGRQLQVPNPRATLDQHAGTGAATGQPASNTGFGAPPAAPGR
ncbi:MAG: hypothetical protein WD716_08150 [Fimbriimonadaceae bacterium]